MAKEKKSLEEQLRIAEERAKKKAEAARKALEAQKAEQGKIAELRERIINQQRQKIENDYCSKAGTDPLKFWTSLKDPRVESVLLLVMQEGEVSENAEKATEDHEVREAPVCETCGSMMVLRQNGNGQKFWG